MKFAFIKKHEKEHCVEKMAKLLHVTRSGYYSWKKRLVSKRKIENEIILKEIINIFKNSKKRYGYPRVYKILESKNIKCGINKTAKLMKGIRLINPPALNPQKINLHHNTAGAFRSLHRFLPKEDF